MRAWIGGSSRVFKSAFWASVVRRWACWMIKREVLVWDGLNWMVLMSCRMVEMPMEEESGVSGNR